MWPHVVSSQRHVHPAVCLPAEPRALSAIIKRRTNAERPASSPACAAGSSGSDAGPAAARLQRARSLFCRRCKQPFDPEENHDTACLYHSALYTGSEVSKYVGFCRESEAPQHQLGAVVGRTGLWRFWDCCGAEAEDAPGCCAGRHVTYDDPD